MHGVAIRWSSAGLVALWCTLIVHAAQAGPAVVFISRQFTYLEDYGSLQDLRDVGFEVGAMGFSEVTPERLRQFNVAIITDIPSTDEQGRLPARTMQSVDAIGQFCNDGGGVLACMGAGGWDKGRVAANIVLAPWDAELLDEQVTDPVNLHRQTRGIRWSYSWTANIAPSPITRGIETVYYPAKSWRADGQKTLYAPKLGEAWQVLVSGEASARSVRNVPKSGAMESEPATYATSPPIAAARQVGLGRAAIMAIWPNWTFWGPRHPSMEGIVWQEGAAGRPSDTGRLLLQMIQWLAEPSLAGGELGGYVTPENPPTRPEEYIPKPVDWDNVQYPEEPQWKHYRVLAGARTDYTTGEGTVAQYCDAARQAGFDAVLFAEPLDQLTPQAWDQLREDCTQATTGEFLALPGIDYSTLQGDQYVAFGHFNYPKPPGLAEDGKHVDDTYNLWGSQMHSGFLAITRLHAHPQRDPQILKNMTACAVYTYENGRLIDDSLDHYLALDAQFHNLVPFSLHLIDSPKAVSEAASTGMHNIWRAQSIPDLTEQIVPHRQAGVLYWMNPHRAYLSAGPMLQSWTGANIMYWGPPAEGSDRWKIKFRVDAPEGMHSVQVLDRGAPYLRFAGSGDKCEQTFPGHHDNQHVFHLIAEDNQGRRLLSGGIRIRFSDAYVNQCGDHQNTISATLQRTASGKLAYTSGTTLGVYAGWRPSWSAPCPVDMSDKFPPMWDGTQTGSSGNAAAEVFLEGGQREGGQNSAATNLYEVAGPRVQILNQVVNSKYPEDTPRRVDCAPTYRTIPTEFIDYTVRRVTPTARFGKPGISFNEVTITAKKDFSLAGGPRPLIAYRAGDYGSRLPGVGDHIFMSFADGRTLSRVGPPDAKHWVAAGPMQEGNYVAAYPDVAGALAIFPLTEVQAHVTITGRLFGVVFGPTIGDPQVRRGDTWQLEFIAASASTTLEEGNLVHEQIRRSLGVGCDPAYTLDTKQGTVESTTGYLRAALDGGAFVCTIPRTDMPVDLFVQVHGLTDGWTAAKQGGDGPLEAITCHDGKGYATLDLTAQDVDLVMGHPVTCTDPRIRIVAWPDAEGLEVYAHNPADEAVRCTVRANPAFRGLPEASAQLTLPPGESTTFTWKHPNQEG